MFIAVIGGGPAGMMAAYAAAEAGADVTLFERNEKLGKKLFISGKGRCNLTNDSDVSQHISNVVNNPRFLYSAYKALSPRDLMSIIENAGVPLKTERGGRVFPVSDKSSDILSALKTILSFYPISVHLNDRVRTVKKKDDCFNLITESGVYAFDKVIICTGGFTYQATGSTGDGYEFAKAFHHSIHSLKPALVGLKADIPTELAGLSLKNVSLYVKEGEETIAKEFGEMLFTHTGISGPIVLTISSLINRKEYRKLSFSLDLKPALDLQTLSDRLVREFSALPNKTIKNILPNLMPKSLIEYVLTESKIRPDIQANTVTKEQRLRLARIIKALPVRVYDHEEFNGAIVTSGGITVNEVDPKTMQSKLIPGLFFAGEILDVDALTGGYNLQIAFSTGYLSGSSAAKS